MNVPVDNFGIVVGENPDCLLLSGTVVGENPDHVCWSTIYKMYVFVEVPRPNIHEKGGTCVCDADYYGNHVDGCVKCPSGTFTRSQTGCTSVTQCICKCYYDF